MIRPRVQNILGIIIAYANRTSEPNIYSWTNDYCLEEFRRYYNEFIMDLKMYMTLDVWESLTEEECNALEFGSWSPTLRLIPAMFYDALPIGLTVTSINGKMYEITQDYKNHIDNDVRGGCLAYGIRPIDARELKN